MQKAHTPAFDYSKYARNMRLALSNKEMITEDGAIHHKYFLVKKGTYWSSAHNEALLRGLENCGVGKWKKIQYYELDKFSELELELRTCLLLNVTDLKPYWGQLLSREEVEEIAKSTKNGKSAKQ